ncbi:capsular biosynthesis protein [Candidatus Thioglobus autotrophicus]|uniref:Capsular biosynthesis protein n=1 Tax=Candidatus Thioglobus autotrophicus TaxID=1705394 RepID=A0A0M4PMD9_9GAMM|nr:nucleoside-diphosphate sugar epimerase/dehydratase [Candidatus Thioglobus autotrophicus]ALE52117.1 capsular biosynthesis protein [Candidatus Thioglobus autotrophicus]
MINKIKEISRINKKLIMMITDSIVIQAILLFSFSVRLGYWFWPGEDLFWVIIGAPILAIPVFAQFGLYHVIVRFLGMHALWAVIKAVSLYALLWGIIGFMSAIEGIPRSVILINWLLAILSIGGLRMLARWILTSVDDLSKQKNVIIYGAGSAGRQLSNALMHSTEYKPVAFIDDAKDLISQHVNGIKVYSIDRVELLMQKYNVDEILLALPSVSHQRLNEIINFLEPYPLLVRTLPGVSELAQGKIKVEDLREVSIDDLLGRESVKPEQSLLQENIKDKVVMVTGAGGSIGSELCRQIIKLGASKLILFEQSELALYAIDQELSRDHVFPILGSVVNQDRVERVCKKFGVKTIYHAAAYKHVPMVEYNNTEGVVNNTFGTLKCAQAAINSNVEAFVLISTDKAVRPTNTMGATKRSAEMILQALSDNQSVTKFIMVRFGNVLNSSGSVIPLFKDQIKAGGPVTVTNREIIRYFMTIPEAVELVIQAGAMGKGGEVFVLDMGQPVKIFDLATKMIHLSGLEVKNELNPGGEIEIKIAGLRPGEKLFEELLIGNNVSKTKHPMIMKAEEDMLPWNDLNIILNSLEKAAMNSDQKVLRSLLIQIVPEFNPQCEISDLLYKI